MRILTCLFTLLFLSGCLTNKEPTETHGSELNLLKSGDIVVSNTGNDAVLLLDEDGEFKEALIDTNSDPALIYNALSYDSVLDQILVSYDSTTATSDKIIAISLWNGSVTDVVYNANLAGVLTGVARLTNGSLVTLEGTTTMELFTADGVRSGNPFSSTITANGVDVNPLSTGGFVVCSTGTANTVRTYTSAGVLVSTATSALPVPTLGALAASSCVEDSSGNIIVAYSGATDHVRSYNSTLTTINWTFNNSLVLATPGKIAIRANGNILVTDSGLNHIVEINSHGGLVRTIGGNVLTTPVSIAIIP